MESVLIVHADLQKPQQKHLSQHTGVSISMPHSTYSVIRHKYLKQYLCEISWILLDTLVRVTHRKHGRNKVVMVYTQVLTTADLISC